MSEIDLRAHEDTHPNMTSIWRSATRLTSGTEIARQSQLTSGHGQNSARPTIRRSSPVRRQDASKGRLRMFANTQPPQGSTTDRACSCQCAPTPNAANTACTDGDGLRWRAYDDGHACTLTVPSAKLRLSLHSLAYTRLERRS